nr:hypothetical protein [Tanacetum cinerariifolium]
MSNTLHNAIMEASSKDRPPMLAPVQIILIGIDNDIYSTVDACPNACEMWKAIERLKQGESINVQDLETNLYWEFRKVTSQDEPSMVNEDDETSKDKEIDKLMALISLSFKKIYKPTNNNLRTSSNTSRTNQDNSPRINRSAGNENQRIGNVPGAKETKPKRAKDVAYHREKMLLCKQEEAGIQLNAEQVDWRDDTDDDELEDQELEAHYIPVTRTERYQETYKNVSQDIRDQQNAEAEAVQIILTWIDNVIYSTVDACLNACEMWKAIKRIGNVAGARETVGSTVVQKSGIQCYNCKEFGHVARECQKLKRAKDAAYHREKMLLCKQQEAGIQLNVEQADWRDDTDDDELKDRELEAHYMYMAQLQEVSPDVVDSRPIFDAEPLQK